MSGLGGGWARASGSAGPDQEREGLSQLGHLGLQGHYCPPVSCPWMSLKDGDRGVRVLIDFLLSVLLPRLPLPLRWNCCAAGWEPRFPHLVAPLRSQG